MRVLHKLSWMHLLQHGWFRLTGYAFLHSFVMIGAHHFFIYYFLLFLLSFDCLNFNLGHLKYLLKCLNFHITDSQTFFFLVCHLVISGRVYRFFRKIAYIYSFHSKSIPIENMFKMMVFLIYFFIYYFCSWRNVWKYQKKSSWHKTYRAVCTLHSAHYMERSEQSKMGKIECTRIFVFLKRKKSRKWTT